MPESPRVGNDEFYTGYLPQAPPGIGALARRTAVALLLLAALVAGLLAALQQPFPVSYFEFGNPRSFEGVLRLAPYPQLVVTRPGQPISGPATSTYLLVAPFKFGADSELAGLEGQHVRLQGTLVYRDDQTMVELVPGSVEVQSPEPTRTAPQRSVSLGEKTLRGEIVDSKCYLGVMKPGSHKPHRACASLCIRGGIPPIFVVRSDGESAGHLLLVGADGRALGLEVLDFVAEPLEVTGEVMLVDDLWVLGAEPTSFKRLL